MVSETLDYSGEPLPTFDSLARAPLGPSPLRRPGSVRRTMSIDTTWPDGRHAPGRYQGHARDIATPNKGDVPILLAEDRIEAAVQDRTIVALASNPPRPELAALVGIRAGGQMRAAVTDLLAEEKAAGAPLYLLLDDMAGASLVSRWAFTRWGNPEDIGDTNGGGVSERLRTMEGVCIGLRPGSEGLADMGRPPDNAVLVGSLPHPDDPGGWHELIDHGGMNFRRARRIDVWHEKGVLCIDSAFQDSAATPEGGRVAVHEWALTATADLDGTLLTVDATPAVLPLRECLAAPVNLQGLIGTPLGALRETVLAQLKATAGCTHLNDAVRALAEAPALARAVPPG